MKTGKTGKRVFATIVAAGILTLGVAAYATEALTPAEIAAQVTGQSLATVQAERAAGKTYGTIASDAGKLDAFKSASLESKKAILDQQVKDGTITQAQADATYEAIRNAQATCDGTGTARIGRSIGVRFGSGTGMHNGTGMGFGRTGNQTGKGMGHGQGMGMCR